MTTGRINQVAFLDFPRGRPKSPKRPGRPRRSSEATERPTDARAAGHIAARRPLPPLRPHVVRQFFRAPVASTTDVACSPHVPHPKPRAFAPRPVPVRPFFSGATGRTARRALRSAPRRRSSATADRVVRSQPIPSRPVRNTANPSPRAQGRKRRLTATNLKRLGTTRIAARAGIPRSQTSPTPLTRR